MDVEASKKQIDSALMEFLDLEKGSKGAFSDLFNAMHYALFPGGKRFRPLLTLAGTASVGGDWQQAIPTACAVECVHAYSLIHDDLPAIDNALLRRGKPALHLEYGEGLAILCGDALLSDAFFLLGEVNRRLGISSDICLHVVSVFSRAIGSRGMVGGQALDIAASNLSASDFSFPEMEFMQIHKTGELIRASVLMGGLVGGAGERQSKILSDYGQKLGLAFQIVDDLVDLDLSKPSFVTKLGKEEASSRACDLIDGAIAAVKGLGGETSDLVDLAHWLKAELGA